MSTVAIYTLAHPETGEVRYVGLTRNPRRRLKQYGYGGHTVHLTNWLRSIKNVPAFTVVETVAESAADCRERWWIAHFNQEGARLLNCTEGGEVGGTPSAAVRARLRVVQRERFASGNHPFADPAVQARAIVAARKVQQGVPKPWISDMLRMRNKARTGIPLSAGHRQRVAVAVKASWTPARRLAASARAKGRCPHPMTPEIRAKISESVRRRHVEGAYQTSARWRKQA